MRPKHSKTPMTVPADPGRLISSENFNAPWMPRSASAWRIIYTTTLDTHGPTIASALVIVPTASTGPVDAIAWAHGSTGISEDSAPSLSKKGLESGALFVIDSIIEAGWAFIATDYPGLGSQGPHPWLIGESAGRAVLDSIRAAQQLPALTLRKTVVWGHSQGGHAALWAGGLHDDYAPDAPLCGVAALAPTADVPGVVANFRSAFGGHIFVAYAIQAYSTHYPDVSYKEYVRPYARRLLRQLAKRPLHHPITLAIGIGMSLLRSKVWSQHPDSGALGRRLAENVPRHTINVPLLLTQGVLDEIVPVAGQDEYVAEQRGNGQHLDYRRYAGVKHVDLMHADSAPVADLLRWTRERLGTHD
jgi:pimeloyl-ACP methyl ester carboxylesterase